MELGRQQEGSWVRVCAVRDTRGRGPLQSRGCLGRGRCFKAGVLWMRGGPRLHHPSFTSWAPERYLAGAICGEGVDEVAVTGSAHSGAWGCKGRQQLTCQERRGAGGGGCLRAPGAGAGLEEDRVPGPSGLVYRHRPSAALREPGIPSCLWVCFPAPSRSGPTCLHARLCLSVRVCARVHPCMPGPVSVCTCLLM